MIRKKIAILMVVLLGVAGSAMAYRDHRGVAIDSLEALLASPNPPQGRERIGICMDLMRAYQTRDGDRCVKYAREVLALSYEINGLNARESALYNIGLMAYRRDDWDTALEYFQRALDVTDSMRHDRRYTEADVEDNLSQLYGAMGNVYNMQDRLLLAIEYYQRALPIFERRGWLESQTVLHHNVGELYLSMGNNAEAEANYAEALRTATESGDSLMMALARKGLLKIYLGQDDYERLRRTAEEAYAYYHPHREEEGGDYSEVLCSMARLCLKEGHRDLPRARAYAEEALSYADRVMSETRCDIFAAACEVAMAERNWKQAMEYGLQSVHPDKEATYGDAGCYVHLAEICVELGQKDRARTYINKVHELMARFATEHYQSGISQMEVLYEMEKKVATIEQLQLQRRWMMWGTCLGALVLVLTALLFFLLWRSVRLSRQHALVQAKLDGQLDERVRLARDLHDRLGGILTALKLQIAEKSESSDSSPSALVDSAIREMRNVSHHLLPDSLRHYGLRTALSDYCRTMPKVSFAFVGEEQRIAHQEAIYCIVYELVNNAVKCAEAEHIRVQLIVGEDFTAVNISDDGVGMPGGSGTGLANIRERVVAIGGRMDIRRVPHEGTEINIEMPVKT